MNKITKREAYRQEIMTILHTHAKAQRQCSISKSPYVMACVLYSVLTIWEVSWDINKYQGFNLFKFLMTMSDEKFGFP